MLYPTQIASGHAVARFPKTTGNLSVLGVVWQSDDSPGATPYSRRAMLSILGQCHHLGIDVHAFSSMNGTAAPDVTSNLLKAIEVRSIQSVLFLGANRSSPLHAKALESGIPCLFIGQSAVDPQFCERLDNRAAVALAMDHLVRFGHRRIAYLNAGNTLDSEERYAAYLRIAKREGLVPYPNRVADGRAEDCAYNTARDLLLLPDRPTAILTSTDDAAYRVLSAAYNLALWVPDDVSVLSIDDHPDSAWTTPRLTTVRQPVEEMIERAIVALQRATETGTTAIAEVHSPTLVVRNSTALCPRMVRATYGMPVAD